MPTRRMSPADRGGTHGMEQLSADDWDYWYAHEGRPRVVSQAECERALRCFTAQEGMQAVDLGCGTGQWTRQLAAWGMDVRGFDFSAQALRQAKESTRDGRACLQYGRPWDINSQMTPSCIRPCSLDLVTCRFSIAYLDRARLAGDVGR